MHPMQRRAWCELLISGGTLLLVAAAWPWLGYRAMGFYGFLGFLGFTVLCFRRPHFRALVDERDRDIDRTAQSIGSHATWLVLLTGFLAALNAGYDSVSMKAIAAVIWAAWAIMVVTRSLVTLWKYRGTGGHAAST